MAGQVTNGAKTGIVINNKRHPQYNSTNDRNVFALLRLDSPVNFAMSVELSINNQYSAPADGTDLTVLGLGVTTGDGSSPSKHDVMFCAGIAGCGEDSCQDYPGSTIVIRDGDKHIRVGVLSWGEGSCGREQYPGVYS
jgi:secreted trypsin-like serine protease